jgi:hypothetical protein
MVVLRLRMLPACEQHRGKRLLRVPADNGLGHTARELTRVRRKVCSVLTMQLIRQGILTGKAA